MLLSNDTNICEIVRAQLTALLDNELAPMEALGLRSHLALCPACTQVLEQVQNTIQAADAWQVEGADIWQALETRIASEPSRTELKRTLRAITAEEYAEALYVSNSTGVDLAKTVVALGYATEREPIESKAHAAGLSFIDLTKHKPEPSALSVVPAHIAQKHKALPVKKDGTKLWVAMINPRNTAAVDEIRLASRCQVAPLAAVPADLERALAEAYPTEQSTPRETPTATESQEDLRAVLTEMRALRAEIQDLKGEVGSLRRLLGATRQAAPARVNRPIPPPQLMPIALSETGSIGLL